MKTMLMFACLFLSTMTFGDKVDVEVVVTDCTNHPIKDAIIKFRTRKDRQAPFWKPAEDAEYITQTDSRGVARKRFHCWSSRFECYVSADGYYPEELPRQTLKSEPADPFSARLIETTRNIRVRLMPKINPIPMYSYSAPKFWPYFGTNLWQSCGYDLKLHDWLPPKGKGEVADFYLTNHAELKGNVLTSRASIEFAADCGAYITRNTENLTRWIVYSADANAIFKTTFDATRAAIFDGAVIEEDQLLNNNECLVVRTRVRKDEQGRIVSCNYAKIYGCFEAAGEFRFSQSSFNPTENDPNLEFDVNNNLAKRQYGFFRP